MNNAHFQIMSSKIYLLMGRILALKRLPYTQRLGSMVDVSSVWPKAKS